MVNLITSLVAIFIFAFGLLAMVASAILLYLIDKLWLLLLIFGAAFVTIELIL